MTNEMLQDERVWIFSPEEPETFVHVNGRMFQFRNGRLAAHREGMTEDDIAWFESPQRPEYLVHRGALNSPAAFGMYRQLHERVMRMAGRKADASDVVKVMDNAAFLIAVMMSEQTDAPPTPPAVMAAGLGVLERQMPSLQHNPLFRAAVNQVEGEAADEAAIAAGLRITADPDQLEVDQLREQDADQSQPPAEATPFA